MYCLDFVVAMMNAKIQSGMCVGINPYSKDWTLLQRFVTKYGPDSVGRVLAGDYSGFDTNEVAQIHKMILRIVNRWYDDGPENARIREIIWMEVYASRHINGDVVYQWRKSLPSGHPMTSIINSLYNLALLIGCYILAHDDLNAAHEFFDRVAPAVYGDDNLAGVAIDKVDKFNQNTLPGLMRHFGMVYTNESKSEDACADLRPIQEVSFLKRGFRSEDIAPQVLAPLELRVILEMPMWCDNERSIHDITKTNVEKALMELSAHPQEVWDEWYLRIYRASVDYAHYYPNRSTREAYLQLFMGYKPKY
jgi:hypothetical protein